MGRAAYSASALQMEKGQDKKAYKDPPYMVDSEAPVDWAAVKVMYLTQAQKQELYLKHKADPETNTPGSLAIEFNLREDRVKALLFLQRKREEVIAASGVETEEYVSIYKAYMKIANKEADAAQDVLKAEQDAEAEAAAGQTGKKKKKKAAEPTAAETAAAVAKAAKTKYSASVGEAAAAETGKGIEELQRVVEAVQDHRAHLKAEENQEEQYLRLLSAYRAEGAQYAETAVESKVRPVGQDYYPILFGDDDGFEAHRRSLLKRIQAETRGEVSSDSSGRSFLNQWDEIQDRAVPEAANDAAVPTEQLGRWKIAFRDLSAKGAHEQPTMIRTRRGKWRTATPLEESGRSWTRAPNKVDMALNRERVAQWADPDGDEEEVRQLILAKTARRKVALSADEE